MSNLPDWNDYCDDAQELLGMVSLKLQKVRTVFKDSGNPGLMLQQQDVSKLIFDVEDIRHRIDELPAWEPEVGKL